VIGKPSFEEYRGQAIRELGFPDHAAATAAYQLNITSAAVTVQATETMSRIVQTLRESVDKYPGGAELLFFLDPPNELSLKKKPFESVLDKLYRKNVIYNRKYPHILCSAVDLYDSIDDLLRTRIVCRYMDGPRFICEKLDAICKEMGVISRYKEVSTDAGYYAWHFYCKFAVQLFISGNIVEKPLWLEIQVATQLSDVITNITHDLYKERRRGPLIQTKTGSGMQIARDSDHLISGTVFIFWRGLFRT
jgi:Region found in RelA / SpoT proteins